MLYRDVCRKWPERSPTFMSSSPQPKINPILKAIAQIVYVISALPSAQNFFQIPPMALRQDLIAEES